jgi:DNA helicase II / ATP-dependent DNA helicase PcrA
MVLDPLFRPSQQRVMEYRGGKAGIAAVPGSGKTFTLSHLAARLVERLTERGLTEEQEVLIVTFSNSAVNTLKARIADIVQRQRGLLPYIGYRVRTLHGLAHDIVRERPALVGLSDDFNIVDERVAAAIRRDVVASMMKDPNNPITGYIDPDAEADKRKAQFIRDNSLPELGLEVAEACIRYAKDYGLTPAELQERLDAIDALGLSLPLAQFGADAYEQYQRILSYRGAVDFDDLVRLALTALEIDPDFLARMRRRFPYILEDEAQDSSNSQERMLRLLSAERNWVRVGDPNQAINTTFTTANPQYLIDFLNEPKVAAHTLAEAGRSARSIIDLANELVRWTVREHPAPELQEAFLEQRIVPTPPGDKQGNPPDAESLIHIGYKPGEDISPERELEMVVKSLQKWLPANMDKTVAVLVPENQRGFLLSEKLRAAGLEYEELLRSTTATRDAAGSLHKVLNFLASPMDAGALAQVYRDVWWRDHLGQDQALQETIPAEEISALRGSATGALARLIDVEAFLYPEPGDSPIDALVMKENAEPVNADLLRFRETVIRWLDAAILPIDQLILTIGGDLFTEPSDIALGYKIAQLLRGVANNNVTWRLPEFATELQAIANNERRFLGFDDADQGYSPVPGRITIATMHAAKGLEWDRVYLLAVSNYGFPSAQEFDTYIGEKWFIRNRLNLPAEALAQMHTLLTVEPYLEGQATESARADYGAERLRLLYVGITRARRELIILWNTGRYAGAGRTPNRPALPVVALSEYVSGMGEDGA